MVEEGSQIRNTSLFSVSHSPQWSLSVPSVDPLPIPSFSPSPPPPLLLPPQSTARHTTPPSRKAFLAARNRWFARKSREKKRLRLESLENEVVRLRSELGVCKEKLARYELIDRQRIQPREESRNVVLSVLTEMAQRKAEDTEFPKFLQREMEKKVDERRQALEQLTRLTLEIALPPSVRLSIWEAENDVDIYDTGDVCRCLGYKDGLGADEVREMMDYVNYYHPDRKSHQKIREEVAAAAKRIRKNVKQMLECQRGIRVEALSIWQHTKRTLLDRCTKYNAVPGLRFAPKLVDRPELSDREILQVNDRDFRIGDVRHTEAENSAKSRP